LYLCSLFGFCNKLGIKAIIFAFVISVRCVRSRDTVRYFLLLLNSDVSCDCFSCTQYIFNCTCWALITLLSFSFQIIFGFVTWTLQVGTPTHPTLPLMLDTTSVYISMLERYFRGIGALLASYSETLIRHLKCNSTKVVFLFCTMTNKCTIISQIVTLLHVSTLSCHPQGACNQYLANLHKYFKCSCW